MRGVRHEAEYGADPVKVRHTTAPFRAAYRSSKLHGAFENAFIISQSPRQGKEGLRWQDK